MKTVYLAGPVTGMDYNECVRWREEAIAKLADINISAVSPMRGQENFSNKKNIPDINEVLVQKEITTRCRLDVASSDVLLINLLGATRVSIGTVIELGWADILRKPVILVIEKKGNPHDSCMVRELSGFRVQTLEEGLQVIKTIFGK